MKFQGKSQEVFEAAYISHKNCYLIKQSKQSELSLLWFDSNDNHLRIDAVDYTFHKNDIVCITEFHQIEIQDVKRLRLMRWNRAFYCVLDHDYEVGCKGVLYYGASFLPIIRPTPQEVETLSTVWKMLEQELRFQDNLQQEMLQMMLKRILILCTRMYKKQSRYEANKDLNIDIVREYNFLVEQHFREKHTVAAYAKMLNKSPKTLSNLFKKISDKTPLQFIQSRRMLEARRLLAYTSKTVSEIGYDLGFTDVQSFSRFFKKHENRTPAEYRLQASGTCPIDKT